MRLSVYCIGKIGHTDWRHDLFSNLRNALHSASDGYPNTLRSEPISNGLTDYCGPFFVSCDHGCAHGATGHGLAATDDPITGEPSFKWESEDNQVDTWGCVGTGAGGVPRALVFASCANWLKSADWVYAWIDQNFVTAHGSCVEIGMAHALGIPVIASIDTALSAEAIREIWFPITACTWKIRAPDPVSGFAIANQVVRGAVGRHWLRLKVRRA